MGVKARLLISETRLLASLYGGDEENALPIPIAPYYFRQNEMYILCESEALWPAGNSGHSKSSS